MLEEPPDYALVNRPKESLVNGNILVKNSPDTQIGDRYYNVTLICPNSDSEVTLKPGLLESAVEKANGLDEKTDSDEVCIANDQKFRIRKLHVLAGATALVLIAVVATLAVLLSPTKHHGSDPPPDGGNGTLVVVGRQVWNASNITVSFRPLEHPTQYVIVAQTAGRLCKSIDECSFVLRYIQKMHIDKGFDDIGLNFFIGGDGRVYVGRGWDFIGQHTKPFNNISIGIAFMGTFTTMLPPKRSLEAAKLLLDQGVSLGKLTQNYTLYCQKQVIRTESPGLKLIELIRTWPHWRMYDPLNDKPGYTSITPPYMI